MKNTLVLIVVSFCFLSCNQKQKIAYIDNVKLINEYQEKIDAEKKIKLKIEAFQKRTDSLRKAFQAELNQAELEAKTLSQSGIKKLMQKFQEKEQTLSQQMQNEQQQIAKENQTKNDDLIKKIRLFVETYGKNNNYDFILGSNQAGSVMYGREQADITEIILKELNNSYSNE